MGTTALELVNRVRRKRRDGSSAVVTDRQGVAYLDAINSSITTILEEYSWEFQKRSDGRLNLIPSFTGLSAAVTAGSASFTISDPGTAATSTVAGDFVTRLWLPSDSLYPNTSFRVLSSSISGGVWSGQFDSPWTGDTGTGRTWRSFVYEYALPATVRQVLSVISQETPVQLEFEDGDYTFERVCPRPQDYLGGPAERVMVGGEVRGTYQSTPSDYKLALKVYPVPTAEAVLDYSYIYRQQRLVLATDELSRVPYAVEDLIVELSTAKVITFSEKDPQLGMPMERSVLADVRRLHANYSASPTARHTIKPLDRVRSAPNGLYWLPPTVEGL